jgi:hypothetical protein
VATGVKSETGLIRLLGLNWVDSIEIRQDGTNTAISVEWPRTNDG